MISSEARDLFPLKEGAIYLNHGGFGVTPREVMARALPSCGKSKKHPARFLPMITAKNGIRPRLISPRALGWQRTAWRWSIT
jgi:hypothetical protein